MPTSFLNSQFTVLMLKQFWSKSQKIIIWKQFIPYCMLVALSLFNFHHSLRPTAYAEWETDKWSWERILTKLLSLITIFLLLKSL